MLLISVGNMGGQTRDDDVVYHRILRRKPHEHEKEGGNAASERDKIAVISGYGMHSRAGPPDRAGIGAPPQISKEGEDQNCREKRGEGHRQS